MPLLITLGLGLFFLIGIIVVRFVRNEELVEIFSISIAAGALTALLVFDLVPEILEAFSGVRILIALGFAVLGVIILKVLDHFVPDHDHGGEHHHDHETMVHIGIMSVVAITIHNLVEGMTVYSIASQSVGSGVSLLIGVGLHNIPMGLLIYSTVKHEKTRKYVILAVTVFSTFIGGLLMMFIEPLLTESVIAALVSIALGMVVFILVFELIPSIVRSKKPVPAVIGAVLGIGFVLLSLLLE